MSSSLQRINTLRSKSSFNETRWVIQIQRFLDEEIEDEEQEACVCIFNVPKALLSSNKESYIPQEVSIGPYHHWRPELFETERYKIAAAKSFQRNLQNLKFQDFVVQHLMKYEPRIRACYHKYLDFGCETLSWMMAIDASFLLEFLSIYAYEERMAISGTSSRLLNYAGMKAVRNDILRDSMMLENQIPLFVLRRMLEFQLSSSDISNDMLQSMLARFCANISPFRMTYLPRVKVSECAHLLDFLYQMLLPRSEASTDILIEVDGDEKEAMQDQESFGNLSQVKKLMDETWKFLSKLNIGPVRTVKKILSSKPVAVIKKLPCKILSELPGASILKLPALFMFLNQEKEANKENSTLHVDENKPPLMEEINIPSVTELWKSGVHFVPTNGDISSISFDVNTLTFYLPVVRLDVNMEVIFRNLVAYELSNALGPLVITRYTELMNGIIDTEEDARILRENGIIMNCLKSDSEVSNLWNGMSKSIRLTKVSFLNKVIEDVNKYYNDRWNVKVKKTLKSYVYSSWRFLTSVVTILLFLLMSLEAFCSVYSCRNIYLGHKFSGTSEQKTW